MDVSRGSGVWGIEQIFMHRLAILRAFKHKNYKVIAQSFFLSPLRKQGAREAGTTLHVWIPAFAGMAVF